MRLGLLPLFLHPRRSQSPPHGVKLKTVYTDLSKKKNNKKEKFNDTYPTNIATNLGSKHVSTS